MFNVKILTIIKEMVIWWKDLIWGFISSKDMKALYWYTFAQFISAGLDLIIQQLTTWNPEAWQTIFAGLIISRITKRLNK